MSIGSRIKELRERNGLSRNELATMLGVTVGAISNYENDVSSPKEPILFKIIESLNCDANYLFQDSVKIKTQQNDVTLAEYDHIKKYRALDEHGKKMVDFVLTEESDRCSSGVTYLTVDHVENTAIDVTDMLKSAVVLHAAHNDYATDPGEQEKMQDDMKLLKRPEK